MKTLDPIKFWKKVDMSGGDSACWPYIEAKNRAGYGVINIGKSAIGAHRVAYRLVNGEIPKGLMVRHHCDNPKCCNPAHLAVGTQTDNMQDMFRRGRAAPRSGVHSGRARFTLDEVEIVRAMRRTGAEHKVIAARFNVTPSCISKLLSGKHYAGC